MQPALTELRERLGEIADLERQSEQHIARALYAGSSRAL